MRFAKPAGKTEVTANHVDCELGGQKKKKDQPGGKHQWNANDLESVLAWLAISDAPSALSEWHQSQYSEPWMKE